MITTLMVANRGEIARRVIRTAAAMGIRTVAVFSDSDARSPHLAEADQAVALGGVTAADSYLNQDKILAAARVTECDAVHPGYGFLAENAGFARACAVAGLTFVGPSPESIETMGLKDRAKDVARAAGVPVLPDARVTSDDPEQWLAAADAVGYPLLVKPTAGGGGKGMRQVNAPEQLAEAIYGARREASSSFGNAAVFLERRLPAPRHVEIQVFADASGAAVHLLERECSVQRRHQKVIEEAPSPAVDDALRERMGKTAIALIRELGYLGAGTIEYLLDDSGPCPEFYFLEMNTRLQVEHPVTEEITGLDLVRLQLQVASGLPLGLSQEDVRARGHAVEARLYAENPARDFIPTPGPLHRYAHSAVAGIRYEDCVAAPAEIPPFYDPMIAKVVAHASMRAEASMRLANALAGMQLHGTITNRDFLVAALRSPAFLAGQTRTDFIDRAPELRRASALTPEHVHVAAALAASIAGRRAADNIAGQAPPGFRMLSRHPRATARWASADGSRSLTLAYRLSANRGTATLMLSTDGTDREYHLTELDPGGARVRHDGVEWACTVTTHPDGSVWVNDPGGQRGWIPESRLPAPELNTRGGALASMSGVVTAVSTAVGERVHAGQQLLLLEAMKMEHPVLAVADGLVEAVHVAVGQYVEANAALVTVIADDDV